MGALLERPDRYRLDQFIRSLMVDMPLPPNIDEEDSVFDYVVGANGTHCSVSIISRFHVSMVFIGLSFKFMQSMRADIQSVSSLNVFTGRYWVK